MNLNYITYILSILFSCSIIYGQQNGCYSINELNVVTDMIKTSDGNYVVTGHGYNDPTYIDKEVFIMKLDPNLNPIWTKNIGGTSSEQSFGVCENNTGEFYVGGYTMTYGQSVGFSPDFYLVKLSSNGNLLWTKTLGGIDSDRIYDIAPTNDGGCIVAGITNSFTSGNPHNVFYARFDPSGNVQWTKQKIGANYETVFQIEQLKDGNFLIAGTSGDTQIGYPAVYFLKIDTNGNDIFHKAVTGYTSSSVSFIENSDSTITFTSANTGNVGVAKISADFTSFIWNKNLTNNFQSTGISIQSEPLGYSILGENQAIGNGSSDFYLIKTDTLGNALWARSYGGTNIDQPYKHLYTYDGGYLLGGLDYTTFSGSRLIKTNEYGLACCESDTGGIEQSSIVGSIIDITFPTNSPGVDGDGGIEKVLTGLLLVDCSKLEASFNLSVDTICAGDSIVFTDNSTGLIASWDWTFYGGVPSVVNTKGPHNIIFNNQGVYPITLEVQDSNAVIDDTTINIVVLEAQASQINNIPPVCENQGSIILTSNSSDGFWYGNGITDSILGLFDPSIAQEGIHEIIYLNTKQCFSDDTISIIVLPKPDTTPLFLPNVFSPNGDLTNDIFTPLNTPHTIEKLRISIYNRWGNLVYKTTNTSINWDGRNLNGNIIPSGQYFYEGTYEMIESCTGELIKKNIRGSVTLFNQQ